MLIIYFGIDRKSINKTFWASGRQGQLNYISKTTKQASNNATRKRITYMLEVENKTIRVCKEYYLATLQVSQQRINYYHKTKDTTTGAPKDYQTGNNNPKTSEDKLQIVRQHIELSCSGEPLHPKTESVQVY